MVNGRSRAQNSVLASVSNGAGQVFDGEYASFIHLRSYKGRGRTRSSDGTLVAENVSGLGMATCPCNRRLSLVPPSYRPITEASHNQHLAIFLHDRLCICVAYPD